MGALPNATTTTDEPTTEQRCEHGYANCDGVSDPELPCFKRAQKCIAGYVWCGGLLADATRQEKCGACVTRAARFDERR